MQEKVRQDSWRFGVYGNEGILFIREVLFWTQIVNNLIYQRIFPDFRRVVISGSSNSPSSFRSFAALLGVITLAAIAVGIAWAWPTWSELDKDVRFDWTGWYWIWIYVAYLTGWAYLVAIGIYNLSIDSRKSREPIRLT